MQAGLSLEERALACSGAEEPWVKESGLMEGGNTCPGLRRSVARWVGAEVYPRTALFRVVKLCTRHGIE